jgi:3(or 17)beta-hydroxysteroid dehydrogenase
MLSLDNNSPYRSVAGRVAIVTGAASGIGKATALLLARAGVRVVVGDVNTAAAETAAAEITREGFEAIACRLDVTVEEDWRTTMANVHSRWGRLDILINNAGLAAAGRLEDLALSDWRRVMAVNLDAVMLGCKHSMHAMKKAGGCIINIASAAGVKAIAGNAAYGSSKAAVRFLTRVAALEGAPHRIRVNSVSPGAVATSLWEGTEWWPAAVAEKEGREAALKALVAEKGFAEPEAIASAVLFLISDGARFVTGTDLAVDAGFTAG